MKLEAVGQASSGLGWRNPAPCFPLLDCKYQKGKCTCPEGWVCQLWEMSEAERVEASAECKYLVEDNTNGQSK